MALNVITILPLNLNIDSSDNITNEKEPTHLIIHH
jgi:hypothetical protein